jgi:hypothetical protein
VPKLVQLLLGLNHRVDIGRTNDPVRMYLREMRSVQLLSREGEVAIAKRIEAGREMTPALSASRNSLPSSPTSRRLAS